MKKIITEHSLRRMIKKHLQEAMRYDRINKQYFPDYTGNPHSDAGKFASAGRGDYDFTRNRYKWSNPQNQSRFEHLQTMNDTDPWPFDDDKENQNNAELYLQSREPDTIVDNATEEMGEEFNTMLQSFVNKAMQKYPVLKDSYHMRTFVDNMKEVMDEFAYNL